MFIPGTYRTLTRKTTNSIYILVPFNSYVSISIILYHGAHLTMKQPFLPVSSLYSFSLFSYPVVRRHVVVFTQLIKELSTF